MMLSSRKSRFPSKQFEGFIRFGNENRRITTAGDHERNRGDLGAAVMALAYSTPCNTTAEGGERAEALGWIAGRLGRDVRMAD
jgi:hypothetical protein